ncbi:UDP-2,3-diacylglucosamine diphosphatase [Agriterribacter sp.]|uniref:UDP-2,3-diacylglucosamine diphosphatase n=1 Tax=Agriterribacter sp. TaxID=2821509 RepID=UPI002D1A47B9|nr:UDP-2,3-diacylglucosamine diphosphatase [Agriterribacter sp.]HTN07228.1 UDP-2,3-diacylglucosamine diphosphatase [Agriterribacter sp.]
MQVPTGKNIYFLSDFHLGVPDHASSLKREKRIVRFLSGIKEDAAAIFIVGDLFDFWYEYKKVVPKGFVRIMGKLAELTDSGIPIYFFVGNHDMWMSGYFENELSIPVYYEPKDFEFNGKKFLIGHGDGLGPGDRGYKFLKKIFRNKACQWLFGLLPPYIGMGIAHWSSKSSRAATGEDDAQFLGEDKEWLISYCKEVLQHKPYNFFIFGHRHLPIDFSLNDSSRYINLGDWIRYNSYAVFNGEHLELKYFES